MSEIETKFFFCDIRGLINAERYNQYAHLMPQHVVEKVNALKPLAAKRRTLGAWSLLLEALKTYEDTSFLRERPDAFRAFEIGTGEYGKPYLKRRSWLHFNLSHSDDFVMCAISSSEIGCDIQKMRTVDLKVAERFFTGAEYKMISDEADFTRIWVRKESVIKMIGTGLHEDLRSFDVLQREIDLPGHPTCFVEDFSVTHGYRAAVCSERRDFPEQVFRVVLK